MFCQLVLLIFSFLIYVGCKHDHQCKNYLDVSNRKTLQCSEGDELPQIIDDDVQVFIYTGNYEPDHIARTGQMFRKLSNLIEFQINHTNLRFIPKKSFEKSTKLVKLDLSNNRINNFFKDTWTNLINLRMLDLSKNCIGSNILESNIFGYMGKLEFIDLSNNHIEYFGDGILGNLTNLRELRLSGNKLVALKGNAIYGKLINLQILNISHCGLNELDVNFLDKIVNLKILDMSHNKLHYIKNHFKNLTKLNYVDLSYNMLTNLNNSIFFASNFNYLDLSMNNLVNVSRDVFKDLKCKKVKFSGNSNLSIYQLRASLDNMEQIEDLDLSYMKIKDSDLTNKPFDLQSYYLKRLNLSNNHLTYLPTMPNFRLINIDLDFSFNRIRKLNHITVNIPQIVHKLKTKQANLDLHHNPLSCSKCDLGPILKYNFFDYKCNKNKYYCLTCYNSNNDPIAYNVSGLFNETDILSCDLPAQSTRLHETRYKQESRRILLFVIFVVLSILSSFLLIYRQLFCDIYYLNN